MMQSHLVQMTMIPMKEILQMCGEDYSVLQ